MVVQRSSTYGKSVDLDYGQQEREGWTRASEQDHIRSFYTNDDEIDSRTADGPMALATTPSFSDVSNTVLMENGARTVGK